MSIKADEFFEVAFKKAGEYIILPEEERPGVMECEVRAGLPSRYVEPVPCQIASLPLMTRSPTREEIDIITVRGDGFSESGCGVLKYVNEDCQIRYGYPFAMVDFDLDAGKVSDVFVPTALQSHFLEMLDVEGADLEKGVSVFFDSLFGFLGKRDELLKRVQSSFESVYGA